MNEMTKTKFIYRITLYELLRRVSYLAARYGESLDASDCLTVTAA